MSKETYSINFNVQYADGRPAEYYIKDTRQAAVRQQRKVVKLRQTPPLLTPTDPPPPHRRPDLTHHYLLQSDRGLIVNR